MNVMVCDLGTWGAAALLAEYDPAGDVIRVNARAVERVRRVLGDDAAERFVRCAVAHERHHRAHPHCTESEAHASAREACGVDPHVYERVLRSAVLP